MVDAAWLYFNGVDVKNALTYRKGIDNLPNTSISADHLKVRWLSKENSLSMSKTNSKLQNMTITQYRKRQNSASSFFQLLRQKLCLVPPPLSHFWDKIWAHVFSHWILNHDCWHNLSKIRIAFGAKITDILNLKHELIFQVCETILKSPPPSPPCLTETEYEHILFCTDPLRYDAN